VILDIEEMPEAVSVLTSAGFVLLDDNEVYNLK
jgi:hypothetical protein